MIFPEFSGGSYTPGYGGAAQGFGGPTLDGSWPHTGPPGWALNPYGDPALVEAALYLARGMLAEPRAVLIAFAVPPQAQGSMSDLSEMSIDLGPSTSRFLEMVTKHGVLHARFLEDGEIRDYPTDDYVEVVPPRDGPADRRVPGVVQLPGVTVYGRLPQQVAADISSRVGGQAGLDDIARALGMPPGPSGYAGVETAFDEMEARSRREARDRARYTPYAGPEVRASTPAEVAGADQQTQVRAQEQYLAEHATPAYDMRVVSQAMAPSGDSIAGFATGAYVLAGMDLDAARRRGALVGGIAGLLPAGRGGASGQAMSSLGATRGWSPSSLPGAPTEPALAPQRATSVSATPETSSAVDPPGMRRSGNAYKRDVGVERSALEFTDHNRGARSLGRELPFDVLLDDDTSVRLNFDELFELPDGTLVNVESKFGEFAGFTKGQRAAGVPTGRYLFAVPTEAAALRTGLPRHPRLIRTQVYKWLWDGIDR